MTDQLPDFLGIGTQKGGTTTLHNLLATHKELFLPSCKEVQYFTLNHEKPVKWYKNYFLGAGPKQKKGEITPFYLFHEKAATRIRKLIPEVKLIILLRDPVERTISHIYHSKRNMFEKLNMRGAIEKEKERMKQGSMYSYQKHSYIERSRYEIQLKRYYDLFEGDKILLIKSEDFFSNTKTYWEKIQKFLGIEYEKLPKKVPRENGRRIGKDPEEDEMRIQIKQRLKQTYEMMENEYGIKW